MEASGWISAIAAAFSALATLFVVIATYRGPVSATRLAAELTEKLQTESERRRLKLWIFGSIMQDRPNLTSPDTVRSLNLIDVIFSDAQAVRDSWSDLYNALGDAALNSAEGGKIRADRLNQLLHTMAVSLGIKGEFRPDDYRRVYYPTAKLRADELARLQQELALQQIQAAYNPPAVANVPERRQ